MKRIRERTGKTVGGKTGDRVESPADLPRDEETRVLLMKPHGITNGVVHSARQTNAVEIVLVSNGLPTLKRDECGNAKCGLQKLGSSVPRNGRIVG
jgi:hypothetical protein